MMKRLVAAFFFAGLALFITALVMPGFIDWNQQKDKVLAQISPYFQRKINVGGTVSFRLLPQPELTLGQVTVENAPGASAPFFLMLKNFSARVALRPLLEGRVEIENVTLEEPVLELEILKDGKPNWSGVFSAPAGAAVSAIQLNEIKVTDGSVRYANAGTGMSFGVEKMGLALAADASAETYRMAGDVKARLPKSGELAGKVSVDFPVRGKPSVSMIVEGNGLTIMEKPLAAYPDVPHDFEGSLGFKGKNITWGGQLLENVDLAADFDDKSWTLRSARFQIGDHSNIELAGVITPGTRSADYPVFKVETSDIAKLAAAPGPAMSGAVFFSALAAAQLDSKFSFSAHLADLAGKKVFTDVNVLTGEGMRISGNVAQDGASFSGALAAEGPLWGGDLKADVTVGQGVTLKGSLTQADLSSVQNKTPFRGFLAGKGNVDFDLSFPSAAFADMIGSVDVRAASATVDAFNFDKLAETVAGLQAAPNDPDQFAGGVFHGNGATQFQGIEGHFKISKDLLLNIEALKMTAAAGTVSASGTAAAAGTGNYDIEAEVKLRQPEDFPALKVKRTAQMADYAVEGEPLVKYIADKNPPSSALPSPSASPKEPARELAVKEPPQEPAKELPQEPPKEPAKEEPPKEPIRDILQRLDTEEENKAPDAPVPLAPAPSAAPSPADAPSTVP